MKRKKPTYSEWEDEMFHPKYLVYIISGESFWKKEFMQGLKKIFNTDYLILDKNLSSIIKKVKYRSLLVPKRLILFESINRISNTDLKDIEAYIKNPSKHAIVVISLTNIKDKQKLLSKFRYIHKSKVVKLFDLDYPSHQFLEGYADSVIKENNLQFSCLADKDFLLRRLIIEPSNIRNNVNTLKQLNCTIDKEIIKKYIADTSTYNYSKFYEVLTYLNRKKIPFITYNDLLEDVGNETYIMYNVRKYFLLLLQAKYLRLKGILIDDDIISKGKEVFDELNLEFKSEVNIWNENKYIINKLMKTAREIPLYDIIHCLLILDAGLPAIANAQNGKIKAYSDSIETYKTFLNLLLRQKTEHMFEF